MIPCPWHGGYHLSRAIVAICKRQVEPYQRCSACRARARRQVAVDPRCDFHRRYPTLEHGDWWEPANSTRDLPGRQPVWFTGVSPRERNPTVSVSSATPVHACFMPAGVGCPSCTCPDCGVVGQAFICGGPGDPSEGQDCFDRQAAAGHPSEDDPLLYGSPTEPGRCAGCGRRLATGQVVYCRRACAEVDR